jgi:predicted transcriptional regulator
MEFLARTKYDETMARPIKKPGRFELRLSDEDAELLDKLADKLGINRAGVYSLALRALARRERVGITEKKDGEAE